MRQWSLYPSEAVPAGYPFSACGRCGGVWIDTSTLQAIVDALARDGVAMTVKRRAMAQGTMNVKVRYRRCVHCNQAMHRRNFARISGVVVDECRLHGTFFDAGELEDVVDFIRSGGLQLSERQRVAEVESAANKPPGASMAPGAIWIGQDGEPDSAIALFLRWIVGLLER